ncbi:MAG: hypothetical protein AB1327_11325 [Bacillota bacterium]
MSERWNSFEMNYKPRQEGTRQKITVRLDSELLEAMRGRWPGVSMSQAVETTLRLALERDGLAERVRTLEMISRATIMMLADHIAQGDLRKAEWLKNRYAQRAVALARKLEAGKGDEDQSNPGPGQE